MHYFKALTTDYYGRASILSSICFTPGTVTSR